MQFDSNLYYTNILSLLQVINSANKLNISLGEVFKEKESFLNQRKNVMLVIEMLTGTQHRNLPTLLTAPHTKGLIRLVVALLTNPSKTPPTLNNYRWCMKYEYSS